MPEYRLRFTRCYNPRPLRGRFANLILAFTLMLAGATGCGYQQAGSMANAPAGYQWPSLYRSDVRTVAVPIFTNKSYYRGVEFNLTKAVTSQLETQSPYKIADQSRADTILEGEILRVRVRTISGDRLANVPQEQLYNVTVNFVWRDLRNGKILVERKQFEQAAPYYPTLGEGQFTGAQQNVERLALAIVHELQAPW